MLAPCIVHFTERQLTWECAAGMQFEASGIIDKKYGSGQVRETYQKKAVQPYIKMALLDHPMEIQAVSREAELAREIARFGAWHTCVREYCAARSAILLINSWLWPRLRGSCGAR